MTVADLLKLLASLGQVLETSGAKSVATELQDVVGKMQPFGEYKLKAFADLLVKAAAPPPAPVPKVAAPRKAAAVRAPAPNPVEQVQTALEALQGLYQRALEPEVTVEKIQEEVGRFSAMQKSQLDEVARGFEITRKFKTKGDVIKAIGQRIIDRKGAYDRAQV